MIEQGSYAHTIEGTLQGGVISPLLLNIALHGMGDAIGCQRSRQTRVRTPSPALVRYADDFVAICPQESEATRSATTLAVGGSIREGFLSTEEKTHVVYLS